MNTRHLIAAIALTFVAASGAAVAQEAIYEYPQALKSQTTRAAVLAELQAARADGTLQVHERSFHQEPRFVSQTSRDRVRAEARTARQSGQTAALTAEPQGFDGGLPLPQASVAMAAK